VFRNGLAHLALPAALLGYLSLAYIARMTRSLMLDQLRQEYVTAARVKGASEARVIWRHALGNIRVPLITVIALSYAFLLEGTVLTETVFAWPGIGLYITSSLFQRRPQRRARRHHAGRHRLHRPQSPERRALPARRPQGALSDAMTFAVSPRRPSLRAWLLAEVPRSRRQARLGGIYAIWLAFRTNPLAVTGLAIVVLLILAAILAPLLGAGAAFDQDLARRLSPPGAAPLVRHR